MREAGRIAKKVCEFAGTLVKPGVTLDYIDKTVQCFRLYLYRHMNLLVVLDSILVVWESPVSLKVYPLV